MARDDVFRKTLCCVWLLIVVVCASAEKVKAWRRAVTRVKGISEVVAVENDGTVLGLSREGRSIGAAPIAVSPDGSKVVADISSKASSCLVVQDIVSNGDGVRFCLAKERTSTAKCDVYWWSGTRLVNMTRTPEVHESELAISSNKCEPAVAWTRWRGGSKGTRISRKKREIWNKEHGKDDYKDTYGQSSWVSVANQLCIGFLDLDEEFRVKTFEKPGYIYSCPAICGDGCQATVAFALQKIEGNRWVDGGKVASTMTLFMREGVCVDRHVTTDRNRDGEVRRVCEIKRLLRDGDHLRWYKVPPFRGSYMVFGCYFVSLWDGELHDLTGDAAIPGVMPGVRSLRVNDSSNAVWWKARDPDPSPRNRGVVYDLWYSGGRRVKVTALEPPWTAPGEPELVVREWGRTPRGCLQYDDLGNVVFLVDVKYSGPPATDEHGIPQRRPCGPRVMAITSLADQTPATIYDLSAATGGGQRWVCLQNGWVVWWGSERDATNGESKRALFRTHLSEAE